MLPFADVPLKSALVTFDHVNPQAFAPGAPLAQDLHSLRAPTGRSVSMPVVNPSAQTQAAVRAVPAKSAPASKANQTEPVRERPFKSADERADAVTLEPHWTATIDAATD